MAKQQKKTIENPSCSSERVVVLINPAAGNGSCGKHVGAVLKTLQEGGKNIEPYFSQRPRHLSELAREHYRQGVRTFWAVGGDGTAWEVLNGLFPEALQDRVRFGILPLGTGNSFLQEFGINNQQKAMEALSRDETRAVDIVRLSHDTGDLFFLNLCTMGFSARVGSLTNRYFKRFGAAGYAVAVITGLLAIRYNAIAYGLNKHPPEPHRPCTLVSFCNTRYTAGTMMMAPHAQFAGGHLDVVHLDKMSRLAILRAFPKLYKGTHVTLPSVHTATASRVTFDLSKPLDTLIDGEVMHIRPHGMTILPRALDLLA